MEKSGKNKLTNRYFAKARNTEYQRIAEELDREGHQHELKAVGEHGSYFLLKVSTETATYLKTKYNIDMTTAGGL